MNILWRFRFWLAGVLTGHQFFNPDASREIDRLTALVEEYEERLAELEYGDE